MARDVLSTNFERGQQNEKTHKRGAKMTIKKFIKENRILIDECIQRVSPGAPKNDYERRLWVLNDEGLYQWAKSEGVRL